MTWSWDECPVSLDKLDDHLKALLRLKIREFVHLSPWFKDVPNVDPTLVNKRITREVPTMMMRRHHETDCPHRKLDGRVGRRHVRLTASSRA